MNQHRCNNLKNGARLGEIECNADGYNGKNCEKATRGVISPLCWGCACISDLLDENGEPYDGQPYWCTECSYEDDLKYNRNRTQEDLESEYE